MYSAKQLNKIATNVFMTRSDEKLRFNDSGSFITEAEYNRLSDKQREPFKHEFKNPNPPAKAKEEKPAKPGKGKAQPATLNED
jgi:hypothetical protein